MANIKIDITKNGTTTLATAGKYCESNIEIEVDTKPKFTNLYKFENVIPDCYLSGSSTPDNFTESTEFNVLKIPYHHTAGEPVVLRMRGLSTTRGRYYLMFVKSDNSVLTRGQWHNAGTMSFDENGDAVWTMPSDEVAVTEAWDYLYINFQYPYLLSADTGLQGPIVTINEIIS